MSNDNLKYLFVWGDEKAEELLSKFHKAKRSEQSNVFKLISSTMKIHNTKVYDSFIGLMKIKFPDIKFPS